MIIVLRINNTVETTQERGPKEGHQLEDAGQNPSKKDNGPSQVAA